MRIDRRHINTIIQNRDAAIGLKQPYGHHVFQNGRPRPDLRAGVRVKSCHRARRIGHVHDAVHHDR